MAPGGRDNRARDRGGDRDRDRGRDRDRPRPSEPRPGDGDSSGLREVVDSHGAELQDLRGRVERVGMLSLQSSRDAGELRAGLQAVFFLTGQARERVMGVLKDYNAGREAVRTGAADKGPPLKVLLYEAVLGQVHDYSERRTGGPIEKVSTLKSLGAAWGISAISNATRPPDGDRPWTLVVTFANNECGRRLRDLWGADELKPLWQKVGNNWPEVGFKPGAWRPGRVYQAVAEDCGVPVKGKGKGGVKRQSESPEGGNKARRTGR